MRDTSAAGWLGPGEKRCLALLHCQGRFWQESFQQLGLPDSSLAKFAFTDGYNRVRGQRLCLHVPLGPGNARASTCHGDGAVHAIRPSRRTGACCQWLKIAAAAQALLRGCTAFI
jgi:hypothetical protein